MARRDKDTNPAQIVRIDGKNCFLEVMSDAFDIGKIRINFRQYDKQAQQGSRTTGKIDIYLGFKEFDFLYQGIMGGTGNGYLLNDIFNNQYGVTIYRGGSKKTGDIIARELKIQVGQKKPLVVTAEQGPGKENSMGGFSIIRNNNTPIERIMIPLELADICNIVVSTNNAIIAHRAAEEIKRTMEFEFSKVKDIVVDIARMVGCNQNDIMSIVNREMPKPSWMNNNSSNNENGYNNNNYNNGNYYNNGNEYNYNSQNDSYYNQNSQPGYQDYGNNYGNGNFV